MKKLPFTLLCGILVLLAMGTISCKKEEVKPVESVPKPSFSSINAGVYDSSFVYHQFQPAFSMNIKLDDNLLSGTGMDTFMLNCGDLTLEFALMSTIINPDSEQVIIQNKIPRYTFLDILPTSHIVQFHLSKFNNYYTHSGKSIDRYVSAFNYNDSITSDALWSYFPTAGSKYWNTIWDYPYNNPTPIDYYSGGPWYIDGPDIRYIAFVYDNRPGWIEVDISDLNNPKFLSYAIKK